MTFLNLGAVMVIISGQKVEKKSFNLKKPSKISRNYLFLPF